LITGNGGVVRVWDLTAGEQTRHLTGHTGGVVSVSEAELNVLHLAHPASTARTERECRFAVCTSALPHLPVAAFCEGVGAAVQLRHRRRPNIASMAGEVAALFSGSQVPHPHLP
ncbi:hypothetical protein, partial [Streptomyces sp. BE133]|uniref:hypothetical protein n=1 Tax=Streptomyces sp. BE133 TaxID=3002523 RepID=UPI002E790D31